MGGDQDIFTNGRKMEKLEMEMEWKLKWKT